jgi:hypothetical protein
MLIDRYPKEDIFARVPKMTERIDPVLQQLDQLLDDDEVYHQVRNDFGKRHRYTLVHGRHCTPVEVRLASAAAQAPVRMELSRDRRSGGREPGVALVLSPVLGTNAR